MTPSRKTEIKRMMRRLPSPAIELAFLLCDVEDPVNVGSIFRIADACGASIVLAGISAKPPHRILSKVSRGKERRVSWRYEAEAEVALRQVRSEGYVPFALEITPQAVPYDRVPYPRQTCLVVGHEDHGLTRKVLAACDQTVFIPMYGRGASLNVHVALAVTAFGALSRALESQPLDPKS